MTHEEGLHFYCLLRLASKIRCSEVAPEDLERTLASRGTSRPSTPPSHHIPEWMGNAFGGLATAITEATSGRDEWDESRVTRLMERLGRKTATNEFGPESIAELVGVPLRALDEKVRELEAVVARRRQGEPPQDPGEGA